MEYQQVLVELDSYFLNLPIFDTHCDQTNCIVPYKIMINGISCTLHTYWIISCR